MFHQPAQRIPSAGDHSVANVQHSVKIDQQRVDVRLSNVKSLRRRSIGGIHKRSPLALGPRP